MNLEININANTIENKWLYIVKQYTPDIYNNTEILTELVNDFLVGEENLNLIILLIEKETTKKIYNLQNLSQKDLLINYNDIIETLDTTLDTISKDLLTSVVDLFCVGLGLIIDKSNTTDFTIENGVLIKYIGKGGVVTLPNTVIAIGNRSFFNCTKLTEIIIPNSVTKIGEGAFYNCKNLITVNIQNTLTFIGRGAFFMCGNLTNINIPTNISIGEDAFVDTTKLPEDITKQIEVINPKALG